MCLGLKDLLKYANGLPSWLNTALRNHMHLFLEQKSW